MTRRWVRKGDELLWSYRATAFDKYVEFDPFGKVPYPEAPQPQGKKQQKPTTASKPPAPSASTKAHVSTPTTSKGAVTPATTSKGAAARGGVSSKQKPPASKAPISRQFVAESSPYGLDAEPFVAGDAAAGSDGVEDSDAESEASAVSSEDDDDLHVAPQPVYPAFSFSVHDVKRKIDITWEVQNEVTSNVAPSPFSNETKLHWKAIGLGGLARRKTELECFMLMDVPVTLNVDGESILSLTNASIAQDAHKRGGALTK